MGLYNNVVKEILGLEEKGKNTFYGIYNGYELTICIGQQGLDLFLNFYGDVEMKTKVASVYQVFKSKSTLKTVVSPFGIHAIHNGLTVKSVLKIIKEKLDYITDYLKVNNLLGQGYCMECGGQHGEIKTIQINDIFVSLDDDCINKYQDMINEAEKDFSSIPNNYGKGILGALLGAFIGAVSWVVIYFLGFLSAISAIIAVYLGNYFYVKFGGKANYVKTVIVSVISLVALLLTCLMLYLYAAGLEMMEYNITNISTLDYILKDPEWSKAFTSDMIMNAVFTVIGVVAQYSTTKKKDQSNHLRISK